MEMPHSFEASNLNEITATIFRKLQLKSLLPMEKLLFCSVGMTNAPS